ncbi:MAG: hypothetical protein ACKPEO_24930 [Sphaerospermopsis kisseleviana]
MKFKQKINKAYSNHSFSFSLQVPPGGSFVEFKVDEGEYSFYLNNSIIEQIEQAQIQGLSLYIPSGLVLPLWYYTFVTENVIEPNKNQVNYKNPKVYFLVYLFLAQIWQLLTNKNPQTKIISLSGFTFNSYYQSRADQKINIILQTTVLFDGDIIHKIRYDLLENANCLRIVSAHYWLTEQIIKRLRSNLNSVYWFIYAILPASLIIWKVAAITGWQFFILILVWIILFLLLAILNLFIVNELKKYIGRKKNQELINWLVWLITNLFVNVSSFSDVPVIFLGNLVLIVLIPHLLKWLLPKLGKILLKIILN